MKISVWGGKHMLLQLAVLPHLVMLHQNHPNPDGSCTKNAFKFVALKSQLSKDNLRV
jgi:hypothetical protein